MVFLILVLYKTVQSNVDEIFNSLGTESSEGKEGTSLKKQLGNLVLSSKMLVSTKLSTLVGSFCEDRTQSPHHLCRNSNS